MVISETLANVGAGKMILIVCSQVEELPAASLTIQVLVTTRGQIPDKGESWYCTELIEQLSVATPMLVPFENCA